MTHSPLLTAFLLSFLVKDTRRKMGPNLKEIGQATKTSNLPKSRGLSYLVCRETVILMLGCREAAHKCVQAVIRFMSVYS